MLLHATFHQSPTILPFFTRTVSAYIIYWE